MKIKSSMSGKIIESAKGYKAFVPNPLPPIIEWDDQLVSSLSRADFILGKLSREGSKLPNPHLLIRPFITREAVLSSKIEGTQATISEVLAYNAGAQSEPGSLDLQEVQNYITALDFGIKKLEKLPLSLRLIKETHKCLMRNVRGFQATPGEFRKIQNWIGAPGCTLNTAKFVPPPIDHLIGCLNELESFIHNRQLPSLIHIALCHYQFEAIHPFLDGNGRIGRLLIILLLVEQKKLPAPLLYLSAFFEATRNEYYSRLYSVSINSSWNDWLVYFLNGIAVQSEDVLSRTERINELLNKWKLQVASTASNVAVEIVEYCAINPYLTIKKIALDLNIAYSTAQRGIQKLESNKIVQQINDGKRDKVYCAIQILDILEEPTKINTDIE